MPRRAVVLLSGGLDSTTALAIARAEGYECHALSFEYGQRHARELESARRVAAALGAAAHLTLRLDLRAIGGSSLTAEIPVPKARVAGASNTRTQPRYYGGAQDSHRNGPGVNRLLWLMRPVRPRRSRSRRLCDEARRRRALRVSLARKALRRTA